MAFAKIPSEGFIIEWNNDLILDKRESINFYPEDVEELMKQSNATGFTIKNVLINGKSFPSLLATSDRTPDGYKVLLNKPDNLITFGCPPFRRTESEEVTFEDLFSDTEGEKVSTLI